MKLNFLLGSALLGTLVLVGCGGGSSSTAQNTPQSKTPNSAQNGKVIAAGITEGGDVIQVGPFIDSGHDSPFAVQQDFLTYIQPNQVLDKNRLLVSSGSNFGAPSAKPINGHLDGAVISISTDMQDTIIVPANFASSIDSVTNAQPRTPDSSVIMYAANSDAYLNYHNRPESLTALHSSTSFPTGLSTNNAFGRPWIANAPYGSNAGGTNTVVDPDGQPLFALLTESDGGVFASGLSERNPQFIEGELTHGAMGTVFIGPSPERNEFIRAVFLVANGDGSIAQVHVLEGIDGLTAPAVITPLEQELDKAANHDENAIRHVGMVFNWVGGIGKAVYVTDALANRIAVIKLSQGSYVFNVEEGGISYLRAPELNIPVDITPVVPEFANADFVSVTTLAAGADMYIANKGNNTIVRMKQDGTVVSVKNIVVDGIGTLDAQSPNKVKSMTTSWDGKKIYLVIGGVHPSYPNAGNNFIVAMDVF